MAATSRASTPTCSTGRSARSRSSWWSCPATPTSRLPTAAPPVGGGTDLRPVGEVQTVGPRLRRQDRPRPGHDRCGHDRPMAARLAGEDLEPQRPIETEAARRLTEDLNRNK